MVPEAQRCQHKIKQRRCMQHANKHALGQVPGYWSAGRLLLMLMLMLMLMLLLCCHNKTRSGSIKSRARGGERGGERGGDAPEPQPSHRAPRPQEIRHFRQRKGVELSIPASCFRGGGLVHKELSAHSTIRQAGARWLPLLGYVLSGLRAPRNGM